MTKAIYETDIQGDFCLPGGALYIEGSDDPLHVVQELHIKAVLDDWIILGSADSHLDNDKELIQNGGKFPPHCMKGTRGQHRIDSVRGHSEIRVATSPVMSIYYGRYADSVTLEPRQPIIFEKQTTDVRDNPYFSTVIVKCVEALDMTDIYVVGFATDYCVLDAVFGLHRVKKEFNIDFNIHVVTDAIQAVNADDGAQALAEMSRIANRIASRDIE